MSKLRQTLYQKQTQSLLLKPKMLQSLEMLAMPLMQLETHLKQEMITNPMLELLDRKPEEDEENQQEEKEEKQEKELDDLSDDPELQKTLEETKELSEILDNFNEYYYESSGGGKVASSEGADFDQMLKTVEDKRSTFLEQLEKLDLSQSEYDFAYELVESSNAHGYLPKGFILESLGDEYGIDYERSNEIHQMILHLSPSGITARNIQECLLAQLEDSEENHQIVKLIEDHFEDLIHKRHKKIASIFGVNIKVIYSWKDVIAKLDPKPGLRIQNNNDKYVTPDIILKKIGNEYEIIINDFYFPKIRMSRRYKSILAGVKKDKQAVEYVRNKINSAKFLIKSVYLRSRTLERVMRSIINNQPGFFFEETGVLNPLTYSVIAEELQVNESTISRVVREKYADTPFGIMCLKDFFTSKAGKDDKYNSVSRHSVEIQIKKMIDAEDPHNPLSDQDIADRLKEDGINVSRRVVAKYRKSKGILNSHLRRKE
ncbi:MAG: RNA polymerase factor sigma-54 [Candidatus Cloacimonetes bacterium]|nr:RNA polymerase factor sigma-54 [Candidatus Cloacimonadota bacterium]MCF7812904.1 RNA polymerase factor sigma-54 [Candidatus Cloacimonadota bacterium]MCF7867116.1 RNA polymerase factor sigma-54 [Candidatus Cloacimonadota bacterium]MCF7882564.1 RNA polymerase factor sigma-54 [Candidatus Cloacimonadota bacterium]